MCLVAEHPLEYVHAEGLAWTVEGDRYPSSVGVAVALMATALASELETITVEGADNFKSGYAPKVAPGNGHRLDGYCYSRFTRDKDLF